MAFDDFRQFLAYLESRGELARVTREVDPYLEATLVTKKSLEVDGPALLFERMKGYDMPCALGVYGSQRRVCMGLDTTVRNFVRDYANRGDRLREFAPRVVDRGPCKENIVRGADVDLRGLLPITWHAVRDRGWYIDATVCIAQHPDTGVRNASVHRLYIHDRAQTGLWMSPFNLWQIIMMHWERGKACPMAVAIGTDPAVMMAATTSMPLEDDELAFAGAQRGKPVDMVLCETIPLDVPATAEIILEGWLRPYERKMEAPFVEFTGYYGDERLAPVFDVTAITYRNGAIYNDVITGPPPDENQPMLITNAAEAYKVLRRVFPAENIVDLYLTPGGCTYYNAVVSIKKRYGGQGKQVASAVLSYQGIKNVVVVDDDIDARNPTEVEWAVTTRCRGKADMIFIEQSLGIPLDPTVMDQSCNKVGIDATRPVANDKQMSQMVHMPAYFPTHTVNLEDYIGFWRRPERNGHEEVATALLEARAKLGGWDGWGGGRQVGYRCRRCGFIEYRGEGEAAPPYCQQCALAHLRGEMAAIR